MKSLKLGCKDIIALVRVELSFTFLLVHKIHLPYTVTIHSHWYKGILSLSSHHQPYPWKEVDATLEYSMCSIHVAKKIPVGANFHNFAD